MIARLACLLWRHVTYRERRELDGLDVMHYVCDRCGHAEPVIRRTRAEYHAGLALQVLQPRARIVLPPSAAERARVLEKLR